MNKTTEVEILIDKAAKAEKSEDALRFSQAASNAAHAMCAVVNMNVNAPPPAETKAREAAKNAPEV